MTVSYRFTLIYENATCINTFFPAIHLSPYKKYAIALVSFTYIDKIRWLDSINTQQDSTTHPLTPPPSPSHKTKEKPPELSPLPVLTPQNLKKVGESLRKEEYYATVLPQPEPAPTPSDPCEGKEILTNEDGVEYCLDEPSSKKSKRETKTQQPSPLIKTINIKCDLISAHCYKNDVNTRILYSFVVLPSNSEKLIKVEPKNLIYLPLTTNKEKSDRDIVISSVGIQIQDFYKNFIHFHHPFELVLHLKEIP